MESADVLYIGYGGIPLMDIVKMMDYTTPKAQ